ncbi:uncharacterized protein YcnI [Microbacterium ginsengiterrae]|uniref:Uncharacterized protein YcnI n=1 Tax=Microbacterium ginsengiterrae TaxID=546115 RepID=A0A7W9CDZ2_9MICO|nr:YcnI family protein [Microbacterium ginsengiterrae]MBB5743865.1 uncharacterized protein YcnI [Microbacterium ginsengiterrae]
MSTTRSTRRGVTIAALAAALVVAAPAAAQAHVGVSPDVLTPEGSAVLTFSFTHGCENAPTTALRITMPEGLTSVAPTVDAMWDVAVERADNGLVSAVTYTATSPVPHDLRGAVTMAVRLGEDAPSTLAFPVAQTCTEGVNEWVEIAEEGEDPHDLESPAPVVTVASEASDGDHAEHSEDHSDAGGHAAEDSAHANDAAPTPVIATVLGAGGLAAGVAALIVALRARRRSDG